MTDSQTTLTLRPGDRILVEAHVNEYGVNTKQDLVGVVFESGVGTIYCSVPTVLCRSAQNAELLFIIRELVDVFKPGCPDDYDDGQCALRAAESVLHAKGPPMTDQQMMGDLPPGFWWRSLGKQRYILLNENSGEHCSNWTDLAEMQKAAWDWWHDVRESRG